MQARMRQTYFLTVVAIASVILDDTAFAQSNPVIGTWTLNVAKSKYEPGPPPMSVTRVFESWEIDGVKETSTIVRADGTQVTG